MRRCDCCKNENEKVMLYKLPMIGYGSAFDCVDERDITKFNLCPECATKINAWIKKRLPKGVTLEDFWKCRIINKHDNGITYEEFEYEDLLIDVFVKFMPEFVFGENYRWERLKYKLSNIF